MPGGEQCREALAQRETRPAAERHQWVEGSTRTRFGGTRSVPCKQPRFEARFQIEDHIADRDPAARRPTGWAEDPKRQILNRKLGMAAGRGDPAFAPRIMGFVDHAHRSSPSLVNRIRRSSSILAALSGSTRSC